MYQYTQLDRLENVENGGNFMTTFYWRDVRYFRLFYSLPVLEYRKNNIFHTHKNGGKTQKKHLPIVIISNQNFNTMAMNVFYITIAGNEDPV